MNEAEELPIIDEARDNYDTINPENAESEDEIKENYEERDEPVTVRIIVEIVLCVLALFSVGLCNNSLGTTLIDLREIASMTLTESGGIFVAQQAGEIIGYILAKPILQRFRHELVFTIIMAIQALGAALIPVFSNAIIMFTCFIVQGFAILICVVAVSHVCILLGGKKRNAMFLHVVTLGTSLASVLAPILARPFLSTMPKQGNAHHGLDVFLIRRMKEEESMMMTTPASWQNMTTNTTTATLGDEMHTETRVQYFYIIIAVLTGIPPAIYFILYIKPNASNKRNKEGTSKDEPLALTIPLAAVMALLFLQSVTYFGVQNSYGNLVMTFAVLGPLQLSKTTGVYLTSLYWGYVFFSRINAIWLAGCVSPFKLLLVDSVIGTLASLALVALAGEYTAALWVFSAILGFSMGKLGGATIGWVARHLPASNYLIAMIMAARGIGRMVVSLIVTSLFHSCGAMTLMYTVLIMMLLVVGSVSGFHAIAIKYGTDGKLHGKSTRPDRITEEDEESF